jgi:tetratricopeptide (TPR) repeat protein
LGTAVKADAQTLAAMGDSALAAHDPVRARGYYERARDEAERTGDPVALARAGVGLGRFLVAAHRYRDAKTEFERAAALDPASPAPYYFLGSAYAASGEDVNAIRALTAALRRGPGYAPALDALRPLMRARCEAAGLPPDYAELFLRTTVTRGELGVTLAVELGLDPDRIGWASDRAQPVLPPDVHGAWGERWLRAAVLRGYLRPYPDGSLHLDDPVTRGLLAMTLASLERSLGVAGAAAPDSAGGAEPESLGAGPATGTPAASRPIGFPDLGPHHYLRRAAERAVRLGLPTRPGGAFDPQASASGADVLRALDRLARWAGLAPALPEELRDALVVQ